MTELPSLTGPQRGLGVAWPEGPARKRRGEGLRPPALGRGRGNLLPRGKQPPAGGTAGCQSARCVRGAAAQPGGRGVARSAQARGGAGTWEGAERSGVRAQGPVAHARHELQAEDLLQEPSRSPAVAAPLVLHPAAIHRREVGESA